MMRCENFARKCSLHEYYFFIQTTWRKKECYEQSSVYILHDQHLDNNKCFNNALATEDSYLRYILNFKVIL